MATDQASRKSNRPEHAKRSQQTESRGMTPTIIRLLAIASLSVLACYWLIFVRVTNGGLTFENELQIPEQSFGTVVDGRRQFHLTVAEGTREFFPGKQTPTAGVNGPYLGPTVRLRRGEDVDLIVQNNLDEMTTMHWHGMHVPARMDGTPHQRIEPGESWTASFAVHQQARSAVVPPASAWRNGTASLPGGQRPHVDR